jgi:hypothetical protein
MPVHTLNASFFHSSHFDFFFLSLSFFSLCKNFQSVIKYHKCDENAFFFTSQLDRQTYEQFIALIKSFLSQFWAFFEFLFFSFDFFSPFNSRISCTPFFRHFVSAFHALLFISSYIYFTLLIL